MAGDPKIEALLAGYRNTVLLDFCKAHGVYRSGASKADMVKQLGVVFMDRDHVRKAVAGLDAPALAALHCLQRAGGSLDRAEWLALLLEAGAVEPPPKQATRWSAPPSGAFDKTGSRRFHDVVARLEVRGLALGARPASGLSVIDPGTALNYAVPAEVRRQLPKPPAPPPLPPPAIATEAPGDAAGYQRRLFVMWSFVNRRRPALIASGLLAKRELKALGDELGLAADWKVVKDEAGVPDLHFDRLLLAEIGVIKMPGALVLEAVDKVSATWWSQPPAQRARRCLDAYVKGAFWNELQRLPGVAWQPASYFHPSAPEYAPKLVAPARATVVERLGAAAGNGEWLGVAALLRDLKAERRGFLIEPLGPGQGNRFHYGYLPDHPYSTATNRRGWGFSPISDAADGWQKVEGGFVRLVLGVLARMGLVDLGRDAAGDLVAVRLTALGRHLLAGAKAPPAPDAAGVRVVVQPNFQVVAFGPLPEAMLFEIEQFADRVSADRALTYSLTRTSVYRGQQRGWDGERVLRRLAELSGAAVPQNVARSIVEWQALHGRIVVRVGLPVVQTGDPAVLDRLMAAAGTGVLEQLAPGLALGARPGTEALAPALRRLDLEPRRLVARSAEVAGTLALDDEGRVSLRHKVPDLATLGWLQRLAIPEGDARTWRVTAGSVRRAQQRLGLDAEAQLMVWQRLCVGGVPAALAVRMKAWTGHYGAARRVDGVVLELPSDQVLAELRAHPDLKGVLKALRPKGPLVAVAPGDYTRVVARLRDLGLEVPEAGED